MHVCDYCTNDVSGICYISIFSSSEASFYDTVINFLGTLIPLFSYFIDFKYLVWFVVNLVLQTQNMISSDHTWKLRLGQTCMWICCDINI